MGDPSESHTSRKGVNMLHLTAHSANTQQWATWQITPAVTSHSAAARLWCLVDHIFSCHDSVAPKPLFAQCQKSSNWGMLYSCMTERIFIPSRSLVTATSARSILIGHNFNECCFSKTLNSTHKGTPANPKVTFRPNEEGSYSFT